MSSRFVLTTNQVVEIMLKYLEFRDWKKAFMEVIPQRKQPKPKPEQQEGGDGEGYVEGAAPPTLGGLGGDEEMDGREELENLPSMVG